MRGRGLGVAFVLCAVLVSCGDGGLSLEEWESRWRDVVASIDELSAEPPSGAVCEQTLGYLREVRPDLDPPPLPDLEPPIDSWFAQAEDAFFECQLDDEEVRRDVFQSLNTFEAEVDTVLSLEG